MGKYIDIYNSKISQLETLTNIQAKEDSIRLAEEEALTRFKKKQTIQDSIDTADEYDEYEWGLFEDPFKGPSRRRELTGAGLFSEGTRGEEPMFKLAGGFIPVPNLGMNRIPLNQPSSYIERDELGYLTSGFDLPMPLRAGFLGPSDEIGISPDSYNQMYIDRLLENLEKIPKKSEKGK